MTKNILKKIPILVPVLKIILDKRYFYHFLQGLIKTKKNRDFLASLESKYFGKSNNLYLKKNKYLNEYSSIKNSGFLLNPITIKKNKINSIKKYLSSFKCYDPDNDIKKFNSRDPSKKTVRAFYRNEDVTRAPGVLELANDEKLLNIASEYFSASPKIDSIWAWWTYPNSKIPPTQSFHRDMDTLNFLKFFVYLTDVDDKSGPHILVKGSHNSSFSTKKDKMHSDSDILKIFSKDDMIEITGPSGFCFLADLFALHKGKNAVNSPRLVLQIIYSVIQTPFGPKKPYLDKDEAKVLLKNKFSYYVNSNIIINQ